MFIIVITGESKNKLDATWYFISLLTSLKHVEPIGSTIKYQVASSCFWFIRV